MRIVLAAEGTRGDVYPMLALASKLQDHGHETVLCASPDFAPSAAERGVEFESIGLSVQGFLDANSEAVARGGLRLVQAIRRYTDVILAHHFQQLPPVTRGADLLLAAGVQTAAASAAEAHGVPYRYVVYCPAIIPSAEHPPAFLPLMGLPPFVNRLLWSVARALFDWGMRPTINRHRADLGLPPVRDLIAHVLSQRPIVAADADLATVPTDAAVSILQLPCLHPWQSDPLPAKLESFLSSGPPPVYFGFGSMTDPNPAATTRTLLDVVSRTGCRAIISEGWAKLGGIALPDHVITAGNVSHTALFPRVSAVIHHGGAGTTTTAARAGVPQILVPHLLDQHYWAHRVQMLGVGPPPVRRTRLTAERMADTLRATLDNELVAERARELGERLRPAALADPVPLLLAT